MHCITPTTQESPMIKLSHQAFSWEVWVKDEVFPKIISLKIKGRRTYVQGMLLLFHPKIKYLECPEKFAHLKLKMRGASCGGWQVHPMQHLSALNVRGWLVAGCMYSQINTNRNSVVISLWKNAKWKNEKMKNAKIQKRKMQGCNTQDAIWIINHLTHCMSG